MKMHQTVSSLHPKAREAVCEALNDVVVHGIDLYTQFKVAHWNIKGSGFGAIHPMFDSMAGAVASRNDQVAERTMALGGQAVGTASHVANKSKFAPISQEINDQLQLVKLMADRVEQYVGIVKAAKSVADENEDEDTCNMLQDLVSEFEKHGWFLLSHLE